MHCYEIRIWAIKNNKVRSRIREAKCSSWQMNRLRTFLFLIAPWVWCICSVFYGVCCTWWGCTPRGLWVPAAAKQTLIWLSIRTPHSKILSNLSTLKLSALAGILHPRMGKKCYRLLLTHCNSVTLGKSYSILSSSYSTLKYSDHWNCIHFIT